MTRSKGPTQYREKRYAATREAVSGNRDGNLTPESPLEGWLRAPGVHLEDGWLVRDWFEDRDDVLTKPGRGLLEGFLKLSEASDELIRAFAEKWGLLFDRDRELVETWRVWSRAGSVMLEFANELHRGRFPDDEMRVALAEAHRSTGGAQMSSGLASWPRAERQEADSGKLALAVNYWLSLGRTVIVFRWGRRGDPEVRLVPASLFGALALDLASAAAASRLSFGQTCGICGRFFEPKRRSDRFCSNEECQRRAAANRARAHRRKRASQGASQTIRTFPDTPGASERKRPA
jgi:hypothetical protein